MTRKCNTVKFSPKCSLDLKPQYILIYFWPSSSYSWALKLVNLSLGDCIMLSALKEMVVILLLKRPWLGSSYDLISTKMSSWSCPYLYPNQLNYLNMLYMGWLGSQSCYTAQSMRIRYTVLGALISSKL